MLKICNKCKLEKTLTDFFKNKRIKDGLQSYCKVCHTEIEYNRKQSNPLKYKEYQTSYYKVHKDCIIQRSKEWNKDHPEVQKNWAKLNPQAYRNYRNQRHKERIKVDPQYNLIRRLRGQVSKYLKSEGKKYKKTEILLGYNYGDFISTLGYAPELCHLDHKVPVTWFKDSTPTSVVFDLQNLQWLFGIDNVTKSNNYAHPIQYAYYTQIVDYIRDEYKSQIICCEST